MNIVTLETIMLKPKLRTMRGFAVWNLETGEFIGAHPSEDRVKEVWCMSRGKTVYGPCKVVVDEAGLRTNPPVTKRRRKP